MGKKEKAHRAKVAKRNNAMNNRVADMLKLKTAILQGLKERGFSSVDEALEKAPGVFSELFPGTPPDVIRNILK